MKKCRDAKDAAQRRGLLIKKEKDELTESVSFLTDRFMELLVTKKSPNDDLVSL